MAIINKICLLLSIVGSLNWGLVGLFQFDLVAWLFGGASTVMARIIYCVIAAAGIICINMLFAPDEKIVPVESKA